MNRDFDLTKPLTINIHTAFYEDGVIEQSMTDIRGDITRMVLDTKERQIRDALVALGWTPPATRVAPRSGVTSSGPSPWDREAKELGGWPGPVQEQVLKALGRGAPHLFESMTTEQIAGIGRITNGAGQVLGATSGMVKMKGRRWLAKNGNMWSLTARGRRMLELMAQREAGNGGRS
jgi:hypothetical protein